MSDEEWLEVDAPAIVLAWDPEVIDEETYANLVEALGDIVRAHGALGLKLLSHDTFGAPVEEGVVL